MIRYSAGVMVARMSIIVPPSCSLLDGGADLLGRPPLRDKLATKDEVALAATLVSNRAELPGLHLLGDLPKLADLLVHRSSYVLFCSVLIVPLYIINAMLSSLERNFLQDFLRSFTRRPSPTTRSPAEAQKILKKRSEEHTSELQSRPHLVCRLLL